MTERTQELLSMVVIWTAVAGTVVSVLGGLIVAISLNTDSIANCARSCDQMESFTEQIVAEKDRPSTTIPVCVCKGSK